MAIVSISEAARLTGKSRTTVQRNIAAGKLSKSSNGDGVDTAELLRVFGAFKSAALQHDSKNEIVHDEAVNGAAVHDALNLEIKHLKELLEQKDEHYKQMIAAKEKHIESLDNAMRLLEDQRQKITPAPQEEPKKEPPKGFIKRLFNM